MKIGIIGTGFVGFHTYQALKNDYNCICTVQSAESYERLKSQNIPVFRVNGSDPSTFHPALDDCSVFIIAVAPRGRDYKSTYLDLAKNLFKEKNRFHALKQIIVISSTSVYLESQGSIVDETSPLNHAESNPKILIETEKTYQNFSNDVRISILRLGEIYGKERNLKEKLLSMQQKRLPGDGSQFTNIIHIDDIVSAITLCIQQHTNEVFNVVCDDHPTRKAFYTKLCQKYGFQMPIFDPTLFSSHGRNKLVSNNKIKQFGWIQHHPQIEL
jgi:nucleoside-diphosphate-sugar epimerase